MKRGIMLLAALLLFAVLTACGMGERKQVETLFAQAVQEYAARESVELHLTVTNVLESGTFIQNDTMLWKHGENWLIQTSVPMGDDVRVITQLQYGDLLFTEHNGEVTCREQRLESIGQVKYEGFDTHERQEDGSCVILLERKATDTEQQKNIMRRAYTMTVNAGGDLVRLLTRDYNRNMEYLEQELSILNWNSPVCAEKIEEAYTRLSESVK